MLSNLTSARMPTLLPLTVAGAIVMGCRPDGEPGAFQPADVPRNIRILINDGAEVTRDTLLNVHISGENLDSMQLGANEASLGASWVDFDSLIQWRAPRVEGQFNLFARFKSSSGAVSEVFSDDIRLDFTARIASFSAAAAADTLQPGDEVHFYLESGEEGRAAVTFGEFIANFQLMAVGAGRFERLFIVPYGMENGPAATIGRFVDVAGNVAAPVAGQRLFYIRGPLLKPHRIGRLKFAGGQGMEIWLDGGFCFISDYERRVHIISVVNPFQPLYSHNISTTDFAGGIDGNGEIVIVADGRGGITILQITPPERARLMLHLPIAGSPQDVVIRGDYAFVSTWFTGLHIVDIRRPNDAKEVADVRFGAHGYALTINEDIAYAVGIGGLVVMDVTDPRNPEVLAEIDLPGQPNGLSLCEGSLFISTEREGILVVDVHNPAEPALVRAHFQISGAAAVLCSPPYLFVSRVESVEIYNATDVDNLPQLATINDLNRPRGMMLKDNLLYVAEFGGLSVVSLFGIE